MGGSVFLNTTRSRAGDSETNCETDPAFAESKNQPHRAQNRPGNQTERNVLQAQSPRSIQLNQAKQQSYLKCRQGFLRSQLNQSQLGPTRQLDLAGTPNLSQLISHASTQRNYQRRFDPPDASAFYNSNRSAEPGQPAQ